MKMILTLLLAACGLSSVQADTVPARPFFLPQRIVQAAMSPDGQIVLMETNEKGQTLIEAILPSARTSYALKSLGQAEIGRLRWLSPRHFLFVVYVPDEDRSYYVIADLDVEGGAVKGADFQLFRAHGDLIDPLPADSEHMLFYQDRRFYRYPLSKRGIQGKGFTKKYQLDVELPGLGVVLTDAAHEMRFVIGDEEEAEPEDGLEDSGTDPKVHPFWYLPPGSDEWQTVARLDARDRFALVGFAANQRDLYMVSDHGRDTRALMRFSPESGTFTETVFEVPGADVVGASVDAAGELVSARYLRNGAVREHHFRTANEAQTRDIRAAISDQHNTVFLNESSLDGRYILARVYGATEEGQYLHYDSQTRVALDLGTNRPWLEGMTTADVRVIKTQSADGIELEGYLTMPARMPEDGSPVPMIVMPHGGPMGIRSDSGFDAEAQFLAANGLAVLEANYRGSGGFGRAFQELGKGEYGAAIEGDIEALVEAAIESQPVDPGRICAFGSSYGGYSSLMLGIGNPARYRCSAAFAAPTDRQLSFSASDWMNNVDALEVMIQWYGSPERDAELMQSRSPVYLAEQFKTPLFLAHGVEDYRVDVEHYHRLTLMLDQFGKSYEGMLMPETGHGFDDPETQARMYDRLLGFLREHL